MKLRALRLQNIRRFVEPVEISGIGDGLNVLSEPNEYGKSTLFDALKALFFERHGARNKTVTALRPHSGGAPEIEAEIETANGHFTLTKRWLSKPMAEIRQNGRLIAQSDAAEDWIAQVLGQSEGGPAGLIWVRQGMTELEGPVKAENDAAMAARRDLMSSVTEEVEAMTGGRRMDAALNRVEADLARYVTATHKPRKNGPLQDVIDEIATLEAQAEEQQARVSALHEDLETRKRHRKSLRELEDPQALRERETRLEQAQQAQTKAAQYAEQIAAAERQVATGELTLKGADERHKLMQRSLAERDEATRAALAAAPLAESAAAQEATARAEADALAVQLSDAREAEQQAADLFARANAAEAARQGAARKADLGQRITRAEAARKNFEEARAKAALCLPAKMMDQLSGLEQALGTAQKLREAGAVQIGFSAGAGGTPPLLPDGQPLGAAPHPLWARTEIALPCGGRLMIDPGETRDSGHVEAAATKLAQALEKAAQPDMQAARASDRQRAEAETRAQLAQAELQIIAPDGIEALRRDHAAIPEPADSAGLPPLPEAQAALKQAQTQTARLAPLAKLAQEKATDARLAASRLAQEWEAARARQARAETARAEIAEMGDEAHLAAELTQARNRLQADRALLEDLRRHAPDLAGAEAALKRAKAVLASATAEIGTLTTELARLDERINAANGQAIEELWADTKARLEAAQATRTRLEHEVAVLIRLASALETARTAAREQYFAPIAAALRPLLGLLWPEAELEWTSDKLLPEALIREGRSEPVDILSGGTQEQIALMVRLAFARLLQEAGRIAPVILDDALVYTDDDRIEKMFDALNRQAGDLQIIVLTCRQRAFRDLGGQRLHLTALQGAPQ